MYQQQKKTPFCALTMYLRSTGNKAPKYEYKADAKSLFTCSLFASDAETALIT